MALLFPYLLISVRGICVKRNLRSKSLKFSPLGQRTDFSFIASTFDRNGLPGDLVFKDCRVVGPELHNVYLVRVKVSNLTVKLIYLT